MSNTQLYLSVDLPVLAILIGLLIRMQAASSFRANLDKRMDGIDGRMDRFEKRMDRFEDLLIEMRATFIENHAERIVRLESSLFRG